MHRLLMLLVLAAPLQAQTLAQPPDPVRELPGAGRPIAIDVHRARRAALMDRLGDGVIVIPAGSPLSIEQLVLQDNDFRQDDYFFYLTGLESQNAWLVLVASTERKDQVFLYLPPRNPRMEQWTGRQLGPGTDAARLTGIDSVRVLYPEELRRDVELALSRTGGLPYTVEWSGLGVHPLMREWTVLGGEPKDIKNTVDSMRVVKDAAEIAALRHAVAITGEAHKAAMRVARPGMYEYQLEATIEYTFRNLGADRVGFPSIVGSGPNSTILHYDVNRRRMQDGDLVVIDIGAEYAQYTADLTRTLPVSGRFTDRQRAIYQLVLGANQAAIDAVRPGVTIGQVDAAARAHMRASSGDLCGQLDCTRYFVHGIGHWLGMRVHDVGDYSMPLEPGMVFTIEPGIYIAEEALGVRIEDDVLVTEGGCEVLSVGVPKSVQEIEAIMSSEEGSAGRSER